MINYILYRIGRFLALILPLKVGYRVALLISDIRYYIFAHKDRLYVERNLKIIFPDKDKGEINRIKKELFRNFAKYLVDFFRLSKLNREYINRYIKFKNFHYIDEALSKGKGVIALTAHIGNWELAGAIVSFLGYPFWAIALPHKHKKIDDFFNRQRESKGMKVIPLNRAVLGCLEALRRKEIVAIVADRDFSQNGIIIDFLGKKAILPIGPAVFSIKTGAIILPGFLIRNHDDTFTFFLEKPIEFNPSGIREKDITNLINIYKAIIEDYVKKYPEQWFMFVQFWKEE